MSKPNGKSRFTKVRSRKKPTTAKAPFNKDKDLYEADRDRDYKDDKRKPNDLSWYVPSKQILDDVARIPYSYPVGYPFARDGKLTDMIQADDHNHAVPGILSMAITPTIGNAKQPNDAINIAANGMYTFVRHLNSGSRNYDANDMLIYLMAVDSLYYTISWYTRLYATMYTYAQGNRYLPKFLVEEQEVDYDNVLNNLPSFRAGLNARINRVSTLYVPAVLPIFRRHSWLFQNYYIEGDNEKDQIYQFYPRTYYVFAYDSDGAGMLRARRFPTGATVAQLLQILDDMIDPIIADEDFNIISGDMYKAYEGNILTLSEIPDVMTMPLVYNEEVLLQFKNAKCHSVFPTTDGDGNLLYMYGFFEIQQKGAMKDHIEVLTPKQAISCYRVMDYNNTNTLVTTNSSQNDLERMQAVWNEWSKTTLLTTPHANVEPGENMINTRLTLAFDLALDTTVPSHVDVSRVFFGTEWPHFFKLCSVTQNKSTGVINKFHHTYERVMVIDGLSANLAEDFRTQVPMISAFKYYPEIAMILDPDGISGSIETAGRSMFELDNYALVDFGVIGRLHDTAVMGEYNIPKIALSRT